MKRDFFGLMNDIFGVQIEALSSNDSGWKAVGEEMCLKSYLRILYIDHEPTEAYIKSLYKSAPLHNDVSYTYSHNQMTGLYTLTLHANLDTGD